MKNTSSARSGVGPIMSGRAIDNSAKRVGGHGTKAEHKATGHMQSGKHRTNNHRMVKGKGKEPATIRNPLRGALMSGDTLKAGGMGTNAPMTHAERTSVARPDRGHLGGQGRPHNVRPY